MSDKCEMHGVHTEQIKQLFEIAKQQGEQINRNTDDVQILKQNKASNDEKFERVFELLGDLKESISEIVDAMKVKNERLPNMMWGLAGTICGGIVVGVVLWLIQK